MLAGRPTAPNFPTVSKSCACAPAQVLFNNQAEWEHKSNFLISDGSSVGRIGWHPYSAGQACRHIGADAGWAYRSFIGADDGDCQAAKDASASGTGDARNPVLGTYLLLMTKMLSGSFAMRDVARSAVPTDMR